MTFETYWSDSYTLRKLSPIEYILDPRWETLGCAVAIEHEDPVFLPQDEVAGFLRSINQPYCCISHNANFDACILSYRYNIHPNAMLCTLAMSRALLLHEIRSGRSSLASVLKHLRLPAKGDINQFKNKHYEDIKSDAALMMALAGYCIADTDGCRNIFFTLREQFPAGEAQIMDCVIRMATQPVLQLDLPRLQQYYGKLRAARDNMLAEVNGDAAKLMSDKQFADLLREYNVAPPMKISKTTGEWAYAFARTDKHFTDLLEHEDPQVAALVAARLGVKSTIEETRTRRLINIGNATMAHSARAIHDPDDPEGLVLFNNGVATLPVPLKFSGAHTHRFSGDWALNLQNLSARKSKELRKCIVAPPGHTIVAVDASQIEARLTAWIAGQMGLLQMFAAGEDTYRAFAADIFHIDLLSVSKSERFVGKTCILGLGFGMSALRLYFTITTQAREQNIDIKITLEDCQAWVTTYRNRFVDIVNCWNTLNLVITGMIYRRADGVSIGPCRVEGTTVMLPGGLRLYYDELEETRGDYGREFRYKYGQYTKKIYGGKLLENVVQALDRQHVMDANRRTQARARKAGINARLLLNVHDENVYCVPDDQAYILASIALEEMRIGDKWADGLPLNAEVKLGRNFGELQEWT